MKKLKVIEVKWHTWISGALLVKQGCSPGCVITEATVVSFMLLSLI